MRKAVLFIVSAFIFSACALSVKDFNKYAEGVKQANIENETLRTNHLKLTQKTMEDFAAMKKQIDSLKNQVDVLRFINKIELGQLGRLHQHFAVLLKALEIKKIKLDYKEAQKQLHEELMKQQLKEKTE